MDYSRLLERIADSDFFEKALGASGSRRTGSVSPGEPVPSGFVGCSQCGAVSAAPTRLRTQIGNLVAPLVSLTRCKCGGELTPMLAVPVLDSH
jgi:hypothetical protein